MIEEELKRLLTTKAATSPLFSYDTTFQLGDFYVSAFLFRHTLFTEAPVIPAFFLIHERKEFSAHEELMKHIAAKVPLLGSSRANKPAIVTDEERAINTAVQTNLSDMVRLRCWNFYNNKLTLHYN